MSLTIKKVVNNNLCTACGACKVVCPTKAIIVNSTKIGRKQAYIDENLCVDCGLCYKTCPNTEHGEDLLLQFQSEDVYVGKIEAAFVGKSLNEKIYKNAQSGGLVTEVLTYLLKSKRIDAAFVCKSEASVGKPNLKGVFISKVEDLMKTQKSRYTQVDLLSNFTNYKQYNSIAVVALPCHMQALHRLMVVKPTLEEKIKYKLGLICDRSLLDGIYDVFFYGKQRRVNDIIWRNKLVNNYKSAKVTLINDDKRKDISAIKRHYLKQYFTPPRCLLCFDKLNISADLVFGDPWGMSGINWEGGESVVLARNQQAESLLLTMKNDKLIQLNRRNIEEVIEGQHIERRKKQVSNCVLLYRDFNWKLPTYYSLLFSKDLVDKAVYNKLKKEVYRIIKIESKKNYLSLIIPLIYIKSSLYVYYRKLVVFIYKKSLI